MIWNARVFTFFGAHYTSYFYGLFELCAKLFTGGLASKGCGWSVFFGLTELYGCLRERWYPNVYRYCRVAHWPSTNDELKISYYHLTRTQRVMIISAEVKQHKLFTIIFTKSANRRKTRLLEQSSIYQDKTVHT